MGERGKLYKALCVLSKKVLHKNQPINDFLTNNFMLKVFYCSQIVIVVISNVKLFNFNIFLSNMRLCRMAGLFHILASQYSDFIIELLEMTVVVTGATLQILFHFYCKKDQ